MVLAQRSWWLTFLLIISMASGLSAQGGSARNALQVRYSSLELGSSEVNAAFNEDGASTFFDDTLISIDYERTIGAHSSLVVGYGTGSDRYAEGVSFFGLGFEFRTVSDLDIASLGYLYRFGSPSARLRPYLGVGAAWQQWSFEASIELTSSFGNLPGTSIAPSDAFRTSGDVVGLYAHAGLEVVLAHRWYGFIEVRRHEAEDELEVVDQVTGRSMSFDLDLSGTETSLGVSYRF